jgi:hypothetical protein
LKRLKESQGKKEKKTHTKEGMVTREKKAQFGSSGQPKS